MTSLDARPDRFIVGTAGHIDHGKTALILALTGVDTDRLPEEQARGITIDLGFAPLDLPSGRRLGVVDVPGHEGLVRTMVAGTTGIDMVLLVVAADEGVMPQTREHLAICHLLGVRRGVVALTRCDLVDDEMVELAAAEVEDLLSQTTLSGAPVVPVSSLTGQGLDALREALDAVAEATRPRTSRSGPPRLWIDRAFSLRGFGSIVTGTLTGGALAVGDEVEIWPEGHRSRIRGLQSHGRDTDRVEAGERCAINLQTLERDKLARGQLLSRPGALLSTDTADVRVDWLSSAPAQRDVTAVELLCGTSERRARLAPIGGQPLHPGTASLARLHVDGPPIAVLPGERFIVRGFARHADTGHTLGGGIWLDVAPPRRRRSDPALVADLERLAEAVRLAEAANDPDDPNRPADADRPAEIAVDVRVARAGLGGIACSRLGLETGLDEDAIDRALDRLISTGLALRSEGGNLAIARASVQRLAERLLEALAEHHRSEPLRPGMPGAALRAVLPDNVAREVADLALALLEDGGRIERRDDLVLVTGHTPILDARTQDLVDRIADDAEQAGLEPPSPRDHAAALGIEQSEYRDIVAHLEREQRLVRAPGDLWFDTRAVERLRSRLVEHLETHGEIDTQTFKGLIGTTRRTAMPLMELFDEQQLTRRRGEVRVLRRSGVS
jgi:selenocysteine-specific elongation factor